MQLPDRPNIRHLRDQAKTLLRFGTAPTLADAQFQVARQYGFPSWPKLKLHVESLKEWVNSGRQSSGRTASKLTYCRRC